MSSQFTKYQSIEAGPFTPQDNRVSFRVPVGMNVDMNESYINLNSRITTTGGDPNAVTSVRLRYKNLNGTLSASAPIAGAMCKRTRLSCQTHGLLEDINRSDVWFSNMATLEKSVDNHFNQYANPIQVFDDTNQAESVWRELRKQGTDISTAKSAPYRLPLNECFMLGSKTLNTTDLGELHIELEMQVDRFIGEQLLGDGQNFGSAYAKEFEDVVGIGTYNKLTTKKVYDRLEDSAYFVGLSLQILVGTNVGGVDPDPYNTIGGIEWDKDTGKLILTFTDNIAVFGDATDSWSDITINGVNVQSVDFTMDTAELVVKVVDEAPPMKKLVFNTVTTEIDNALNQMQFEKQYQTEGNCYNLWVMTPDGDSDLVSENSIIDYRLRSENVDLTNRNIRVGSSVYLDQVGRSCKNTGRLFKNTNITMPVCTTQSRTQTMLQQQVRLLTTPLNITPLRKSLNLQVNSLGLNKLILFKEVMKSF